MKSIVRLVAALALIGAIGGCAQFGLQGPGEWAPSAPGEVPYSD